MIPQSAVSKSGVLFLLVYAFELVPEILDSLWEFFFQSQIYQRVLQIAAHQEFKRNIVDEFHVFMQKMLYRVVEALQ